MIHERLEEVLELMPAGEEEEQENVQEVRFQLCFSAERINFDDR